MAILRPAETLLLQVGRQSACHWLGASSTALVLVVSWTTTLVTETKAHNNGLVL